MKLFIGILVLAFVLLPVTGAAPQPQDANSGPPPWAFLVPPPPAGGQGGGPGGAGGGPGRGGPGGPGGAAGQGRGGGGQAAEAAASADEPLKHVPNSTVGYTAAQIRDGFNVPDWHPNEHSAMNDVVEHGRKPDVRACAWCHLPTGIGRPENSSLSGLPASYIMQQFTEWKTGERKSSNPRFGGLMPSIAKAATDAEIQAAADYYAAQKPKQWIRVVETDMVPNTTLAGMLVPVAGGGMEPIGMRIIEAPENPELTELRDEDSGFVAYVPKGSIEKGATLVTAGGGGKTLRCVICHGDDLKGIGPVPGLAGRSPSYLFRQLYDIQHGNRNGMWTQLMKEPVAHLTTEDMISITAYLASLKP